LKVNKKCGLAPFLSERVRGVEPPSLPWQGSVIAVILHPQFCAGARNRTESFAFSEQRAHQLHYPGKNLSSIITFSSSFFKVKISEELNKTFCKSQKKWANKELKYFLK
jgi:hypothetical protein